MEAAAKGIGRHDRMRVGTAIAVYVWQYPLRLVHWGLVISIFAMSITGYYIHDPFIVGQTKTPFLMGSFRFVHEAFGMAFISFFLLRFYLLFAGDRWVRWRALVPLKKAQWREMVQMLRFYFFLRPTPIAKVGHNAMAAVSYLIFYGLVFVEILTGLAMFNWLAQSAFLGPLVGWVPRVFGVQRMRLIHFLLMYVFIAFGIFHVHICLLVSRTERRGLMDSIFTGYKIIPVDELEEDDRKAILSAKGSRVA